MKSNDAIRQMAEHLDNGENVLIVTNPVRGRQIIGDLSKMSMLSIDFMSISDSGLKLKNGRQAHVVTRAREASRFGYDVVFFDSKMYPRSSDNASAYDQVSRLVRKSGIEGKVF